MLNHSLAPYPAILVAALAAQARSAFICMEIDYIVDTFVERLNQQNVGIQAFSEVSWVNRIFNRLPARLPPSFVSLISRYIFDDFEVEDIWFYANRGEKTWKELSQAIFRDEIIFRVTTSNGFLHFARPSDGSYDPLCFDIRRRNNTGECPIVRLDHEVMLQREQIKVVSNISSSLLGFMESYVNR